MQHYKFIVGVASLVASLALAAPVHAQGLDGTKWVAAEMKRKGQTKPIPKDLVMVAHFKRGGAFVSTMTFHGKTQRKSGTWSVKGDMLTTRVGKKVETMRFAIEGSSLVLSKKRGTVEEQLVMKPHR